MIAVAIPKIIFLFNYHFSITFVTDLPARAVIASFAGSLSPSINLCRATIALSLG
jgi:hypothetical protein